MPILATNILALDVGERRIGVALMRHDVKLSQPLTTIRHDETVWQQLLRVIEQQTVGQLVVGLPRNLNGEETPQTTVVRQFVQQLATHTSLPIELQDEALTSVEAERLLRAKGKPYEKADIDAIAASLILNDFAHEQGVLS